MSLIRFTPFHTLDVIREQLARTFEESDNLCCAGDTFYLPIELSEDEKSYYLRINAPGIDPEKISIEVEEGVVTVGYENKSRELKENEKMHISEFCYGQFKRSIKLGNTIDTENICAEYLNGVTTVTIKKSPESTKKVIKIQNMEEQK